MSGALVRIPPRNYLLAGGLILALSTIAAIAGGVALRIVLPDQRVPTAADAVVVLSGGMGERVNLGQIVFDEGIAKNILFSQSERVREQCETESRQPEIHCVDAAPGNTKGEAASIAEYAHEQGWDSLILVTSSYHMQRASRWLERCFDGEVFPIAADATTSFGLGRHEWLATMVQLTFDRSC
ncbi:MAG: YdcF family protein [Acidimicrobiales bacterium]